MIDESLGYLPNELANMEAPVSDTENESSSGSSVGSVSDGQDPVSAVETEIPAEAESTETVEVTEQPEDLRPFMTTSFQDYTVTEGLLLMILLALIVSGIVRLAREVF